MTTSYPTLVARITLFAVLVLPTVSVYAQIPAGGSSGRNIPSASRSDYDLYPFDPTLQRLPTEYKGADLQALLDRLAKREGVRKDEFETTEQFRLRVQKEAESPILGSLRVDSIMAAIGMPDASYDADDQVMRLLVFPSAFGAIELAGYKGRAFVAELKLDIPTAKRTKNNLRALAVFRLRAPPIQQGYRNQKIPAQLLEVWFYDFTTGQVFVKKRADEGISSLPPDSLLQQAYELYRAHLDDEALSELHRVVMLEPTSA